MNNSWYDTAQICINGHIVNWMSKDKPEYNKNYCEKCGVSTITSCQQCNSIIKGYRHAGRFNMEEFDKGLVERIHQIPDVALAYNASLKLPSFCPDCGKPYPWTEAKIKAAIKFSDELDNLNSKERETLKKSLDAIVRDTPETTGASFRFKKIVAKAGKTAADGLKDILVDIASEAAKRIIWPLS
jgi:hypothetical protein